MNFPTCFRQPPSTCRRHRLATQISAQLVLFQTGGYLPPIQSASKYKPKVSQDFEQRVARYASRKLSNGDVRGAVRILASDATYVTPDRSTFELLLPKHPPAPTDRHQAPPPHAAPFRCGAEQLFRALNSFKPGSAAGPDGLTSAY